MSIEEVREQRKTLQVKIAELIQKFEDNTGTKLDKIDIAHSGNFVQIAASVKL